LPNILLRHWSTCASCNANKWHYHYGMTSTS
jgi:hypothetical protein